MLKTLTNVLLLLVLAHATEHNKAVKHQRLKSVRAVPTPGNPNPYSGYVYPNGVNPGQGISYQPQPQPQQQLPQTGYPYRPNNNPGTVYRPPNNQVYPNTPLYTTPYPPFASTAFPSRPQGANPVQAYPKPQAQIIPTLNPHAMGAVQTTTTHAPNSKVGTNSKGFYMALFLMVPCIVSAICIIKMFFIPSKPEGYFPEPMLFNDPKDPYRSHSQPVQRSVEDPRHSSRNDPRHHSAMNHWETQGYDTAGMSEPGEGGYRKLAE